MCSMNMTELVLRDRRRRLLRINGYHQAVRKARLGLLSGSNRASKTQYRYREQ